MNTTQDTQDQVHFAWVLANDPWPATETAAAGEPFIEVFAGNHIDRRPESPGVSPRQTAMRDDRIRATESP